MYVDVSYYTNMSQTYVGISDNIEVSHTAHGI
jgi:hypothetical protein